MEEEKKNLRENTAKEERDREKKILPGDLTFHGVKRTEEEREKTEFQKKVENFFYYNKWKVLAAVFAVFVVVVCIVQTCNRVNPDVYLTYAGSKNVNKTFQNGDVSEYQTLHSSLRKYAEDNNKDGKIALSLQTLFVLSEEEKEAMKKNLEKGEELNETILYENQKTLSETLFLGDNFLYLLSESAYLANKEIFLPLNDYLPEGCDAEMRYDDCAILLSATPAGKKPGVNALPSDTVVCVRKKNAGLGGFGKKRADQNFTAAVGMVENMIRSEE